MATHLVTGGAGFLGSHTVRALHARGERVRVLDVIPAPELPPGVEFVQADIRDRRAVLEATDGIEIVHHHAAMVPLTKAGAGFREVNVDGTQHALDAARAVGAKLFIHVSTSAVYGVPERCPITEETPLRPFEAYGHAKLEGERRVERAAREGLPCAIVRPRTLIGLERLGIFQILFEWIREGRRIYVIGQGNEPFQLLHVEDAVDLLLRLADQRKTGVYNVGAERFGTLREDLTALVRHAGTAARVAGIPAGFAMSALGLLDRLRLSPLAPWHYRTYHKAFFFDLERPMRELGWRPRYGNVEALTQAYDWFLAHRDDPVGTGGRSTHRKSVRQGVLRLLKGLS
jgi:nucleoside-diphosphate-sugar epimerase